MPKEFTCPNCGAPLDPPPDSGSTMRCPFCNTSVVIPEELRVRPGAAAPAWQGFEATIGQAQQLGQIKRLADAGQLIEAIKLYRETFDTSLAEAKAAVEALAAGRPVQISRQVVVQSPVVESFTLPAAQTARPSRTGGAASVVGAVAVLLLGLGVGLVLLFSGSGPSTVGDLVGQVVPLGFATQKLSFGEEGTGPGLFNDSRALTVDPDGRIYVADYQGGRVQVFNADGKFVTQWMVGDKHTLIPALAADRSGHVFIVYDSRLFQYDAATGDKLAEWEHPDGWGIRDIVATPDGGIVAAWYKNRDDLVRFNNDGEPEKVIEAAIGTAADDSELDTHVAVDGQGNIFALGTFTTAVFKFSPAGKFLSRFGSDGDEPGQFRAPGVIAVDGQGRVYVTDFKGIQVFDSDGRYVDVIPLDGYAYRLTFDDQGFLYASFGTRVDKYQINR